MTQEDKELLLKDLCARLPYGVKIQVPYEDGSGYFDEIVWEVNNDGPFHVNGWGIEYEYVKPYLFPLSSMTEEEAKELSVLYGIKDILSINITDEYIDFKVDDGFCSFERKTIWYNEIISSTETFDWLNKNHFDYRGLIEKGLAIDATGLNIYC